jgi:hypothetical protein
MHVITPETRNYCFNLAKSILKCFRKVAVHLGCSTLQCIVIAHVRLMSLNCNNCVHKKHITSRSAESVCR